MTGPFLFVWQYLGIPHFYATNVLLESFGCWFEIVNPGLTTSDLIVENFLVKLWVHFQILFCIRYTGPSPIV